MIFFFILSTNKHGRLIKCGVNLCLSMVRGRVLNRHLMFFYVVVAAYLVGKMVLHYRSTKINLNLLEF